MSASPPVRGLRAAVFGVVCVLLAAAAHALATGAAPPVRVDVLAFLPVFAAGYALGGRERSLLGIGGAMLAVQTGLHLAFDAARSAHPAATPAVMPGMAHMPGMTHLHSMSMAAAPSPVTAPHAMAAHLAAALLASWCLRRGEAALWTLLGKAVALVPGLAAWWHPAPLPAYADVPRARRGRPRPPCRLLLRHALSRRGPPAGTPYAIRPPHTTLTRTEFPHPCPRPAASSAAPAWSPPSPRPPSSPPRAAPSPM